VTNNPLPGGGKGIGIYEASDGGVVVSGLAVVEAGFGIVVVTAIAQGVNGCMGTGSGGCVAVGVVLVPGCGVTCGVYQSYDIALEVGDVIVDRAVLLHGNGGAICVIEEVQDGGAVGFPEEFAAGVVGSIMALVQFQYTPNPHSPQFGLFPNILPRFWAP